MSDYSTKGAEQQRLGKLTAMERIEKLLDDGSFIEIDKYVQRSNAVLGYADVTAPGEGLVAGWGTVDGRPVYLFAQDYTVLGGSFGAAHADKICKIIDMAAKSGLPVLCIWDSQGARVQEGAAVLAAYAKVLKKLTDVSGVVPTVSIAGGGMIGNAAFLSAMTDFTVAIEKVSEISLVPPMVLASTEGKAVDGQALCGAQAAAGTGNVHFVCADEQDAALTVKKLLSYLPSNNLEDAPASMLEDDPSRMIQADGSDMRALASEVADAGTFLEVQADYAPEMVTAFAMMNGFATGIVANVPGEHLSPKGCRKAARFIRLLDAYDIPIVSFVDNMSTQVAPSHGKCCQLGAVAKLISAYSEASTAMVSVTTGRAIGDGYVAMSNKGNGADIAFAYPCAEISCVEAEAGAIIMMDGNKSAAGEYREKFAAAKVAAQQGVIDDVIQPAETRKMVLKALDMAVNKREQKLPKKHGVLPL